MQLSTVMGNNGGLEGYGNVIAAAEALEKVTTYEADGLIGGAAELGTYLSDAKALEAMLPTLANYAAGMGGMTVTAEQMVNYATDLGKALDGTYDGLQKKGFILDEAQKQVIEFGTDLERVAVITDVINQSWDGLALAFAQTPEGQMQQFANTMGNVAETVGSRVVGAFLLLMQTVMAFVESPAGQWLLEGVIWAINAVLMGLMFLIQVIQAITTFVMENWAIIQPILMFLAFVILVAIIIQLWAMVAPIVAQAMAWLAAYWPILLVIAGIALLMMVLNEMGITWEEVITFVAGLLGALAAYWHNIVAFFWNMFATLAEFFANVFNHPLYTVKRLFANWAGAILQLVHSIAEAIDAVFGSSLAGAVTTLQANIEAWVGEMPEGYKVMKKMENMSIPDTFETWSKGASDLTSNITGMLESFNEPFAMEGLEAFGAGGGGGAGAGGGMSMPTGGGGGGTGGSGLGSVPNIGKVGEVGKINNEVDISKEDLELLRDIAEARFTQNLVTLTPQVSLRVDTVNENADIDRLVAQLEEKLEEEFVTSVEGVYS